MSAAISPRREGDVECNLCGWRGSEFNPRFGPRGGRLVACPNCRSLDRSRHLWAVLPQHARLDEGTALLDVAPTPALSSLLSGCLYVAIDVQAFTPAIVPMNVTRLEFPDNYFHIALFSHVLEHIRDDAAALRELHRVLQPGGTLFLQVPYKKIKQTEHLAEPNKHGHVRIYSRRELPQLLEAPGFELTTLNMQDARPEWALDPLDVFILRKRTADDSTPNWDYSLLRWIAARAGEHGPGPGAFSRKPIST